MNRFLVACLGTLIASGVHAKATPATEFAKIEETLRAEGFGLIEGLQPPDWLVPRMVWQQAPLGGVPKQREALRLATRAERLGRFEAALGQWQAIAGSGASSPKAKREAALAIIRLQVTNDPPAARAALEALPTDIRNGLGADILEGRLLIMEGKPAAALDHLASLLLPAMRAGQAQPLQLFDDMALAATFAGDTALAGRLFAKAGSNGSNLTIDVPLARCHPNEGLQPGDRAIFDITIDPVGGLNRATPVWASRAGTMAWQLAARALEGRGFVEQLMPNEETTLRQRVLIGCAPHDVVPLLHMAQTLFADVGPDGSIHPAAAVKDMDRYRQAPSSPDQMLLWLENAPVSVDVRLLWLADIVLSGRPRPDFCGYAERLASESKPDIGIPGRLALASALSSCESPETAARLLSVLAEDETLGPADRRAFAARALAQSSDPSRRSSMTRIAEVAPDSCLLADSQSLKGMAIEEDDFPLPLRKLNVQGRQMVAYQRTGEGGVAAIRPLLARPPLLFDSATEGLLNRVPPLPATRDGKPVTCTGQISNIRWQLNDWEEPAPAEF